METTMTSVSVSPKDARLERLFEATDSNRDGHVEWSDYERIVDLYLSKFKVDRNSSKAQALRATHMMFWTEVLRHGPGEDRLTKEEYLHAVRSAALDTSRFNLVEGVPNAIFDVIDRNDDGSIDKQEFARFLQVWEITDPAAMEVFTRLDADGDGTISRQEYIRSWREFFYSDSPDVPGTLYLGRV
jgi:Ca2+-binding EF-hand superfamily protein